MIIEPEDKPLFALGIAFIASTLVLGSCYTVGKIVVGDAAVAFAIAFTLSLLTLRFVHDIITYSKTVE